MAQTSRRHSTALPSKPKDSPLDRAANELIEAHKKRREFIIKHRSTITALAKLEIVEKQALERVKDLARERSILGHTTILIDKPTIHLSVQGKQEAPSYNYEIVAADWPAQVAAMVTSFTIDPSRVELAVKSELLTPELMQAAMLPRVAMTPTVIVKHEEQIKKIP